MQALTREISSDHTPLLLSFGDTMGLTPSMFKFELGWLTQDDFHEVVEKVWREEDRGVSSLERWQNKIRWLRQFLRVWAKNKSSHYKKEKKDLISKLEVLDKKAENETLLQWEIDLKQTLKSRLIQLLREEEIKWYQRGKTTKILQGDMNTKYFQLIANGKHRKTRIFQLEDGDKIIKGDGELKKYITDYYRGLFSPSENSFLTINENRRDDIPQVTDDESESLITMFTQEEVQTVIFQMERNKALGPDGFPAEFYQDFSETIKDDFMDLFQDFHEGILPLFILNFGIITLLPKMTEAVQIQQYRPICLLNVSVKIFTKVVVNRLTNVADKIIRPTQSAFMPRRHILEGVVVLHETLQELQRKILMELF